MLQQSSDLLLLRTNLTEEQSKAFSKLQPNLVVLDTCFETLDFYVMKDKIVSLAVEKFIREISQNEEDKMKIFIDTELVKWKSCVKVSNNKRH